MKNYSIQRRPSADEEKPLWQEILAFNKSKYLIVIVLFLLAASGLIIPIIPGLFIFILALALLRRGWMTELRKHIRLWKVDKQK